MDPSKSIAKLSYEETVNKRLNKCADELNKMKLVETDKLTGKANKQVMFDNILAHADKDENIVSISLDANGPQLKLSKRSDFWKKLDKFCKEN